MSIQSTLEDVARAAGVSAATVSRVLNGNLSVRPELKLKVEEAAALLAYVPHASARALASNKTRRVASILPTIDNSIFARFIEAIQKRVRRDSYGMMLSVTDFDEELEKKIIQEVSAAGVDGIILVGAQRSQETYDFLLSRKIQFILTNIHQQSSNFIQVGYDNFESSRSMVRYLLDIGHIHFAAIDGPIRENDRAQDRFKGVQAALNERNIEMPPGALIEKKFTFEEGRKGFRTVIEHHPEVTAIVCGNDILAIGALFEARSMGLRIPADMSIAGFDDLDIASQLDIGLTTIRVPMDEMGELAGDTLVAMIDGKLVPKVNLVTTSLIIRGSTGVPRKSLKLKLK